MIDHPAVAVVALLAGGYAVGSIPFGVIIARAKGVDLRKVGSGNVGATNVGRAVGRRWGYVCFVLDVGKGLASVVAGGLALGVYGGVPSTVEQAAWLSAGLGAVLGHVFSLWLGFRGGKGVATSLGVVLGIYPYFTWPGLCALGVWVAVTLLSRYVSLGSVVAAAAFAPLFVAFHRGQLGRLWPLLAFAAAVVAMVIVRHRTNISRLLAGTENKIASSRRRG
jgi:glycerol-3-phosphate acyltransferase PlsY